MGQKRGLCLMAKMIAPRLANGDSREGFGHGLPSAVKDGLKKIAKQENKSMSWVVEQVIIEYFHLRRPRYKLPKSRRK